MDIQLKRKQSFLLRLPVSIREEATRVAHQDGTSLNHFIALALTEKLSRMEASKLPAEARPQAPLRMAPYPQPFRLQRPA